MRSGNEFHGDAAGAVVQAGTVHGGIHISARSWTPAPAQLRARPAHFTNRIAELAELSGLGEAAHDGSPQIIVLTGPGGVGKTSLGLAWLHQIRERYPDGQLFAELRMPGSAEPVQPSVPLEAFLRALGTPPDRIPLEMGEQAALFRSLTSGRRLIVLLDDAATAAQVRPLLPGQGSSVVVVTTRRRLSGLALDGASFVPVDSLKETDAVELLTRMLGEQRTGAEPEAARELVRLCERLPLAVCTSAARLKVRGRLPIARIVEELVDERGRLTALSSDEDTSLRAAFDISYAGLAPGPARLLRLLAINPEPHFDAGTAAVLDGCGTAEAGARLEELAEAHLIAEETPAVYRFHDLLRLYADELMELFEEPAAREEAFDRLLRHRILAAAAADIVVNPGRWHLAEAYAHVPKDAFPDTAEALDWLESELPGLLVLQRAAADRGRHEAVWQLAETLRSLFGRRKHYRAWLDSYALGLASARICDDAPAQARMLVGLGDARLELRDPATAAEFCEEAVDVAQEAGHALGEAAALEGLGRARLADGHADEAVRTFAAALAVHHELDRPRGIALMTSRLGEALRHLGRHAEAAEHLTAARAYFAARGDDHHEARILLALADIQLALAEDGPARESLDRALDRATRSGAVLIQAGAELALADLAARTADVSARRGHLERAVELLTRIDAAGRHDAAAQLAALDEAGPGEAAPT
ncbi:ATP-binding protein [Actinocorallia aurantiaca]|uniref:Tetratricopeptide repeat protein n=1 Tax=Actinocorallia aurantiaca TaxID=46204 RepID=A0ABN3UP30_9ACTN